MRELVASLTDLKHIEKFHLNHFAPLFAYTPSAFFEAAPSLQTLNIARTSGTHSALQWRRGGGNAVSVTFDDDEWKDPQWWKQSGESRT